MSSPNHPISDIEDVFSSNFPNYIPASPDYFPASPGNTSFESSNNPSGLVPIASPTLSLFHDDPYMKVMHAYYAKESPISPPTIVPPSPMLSPMYNSQEFFLPEELLPPKKYDRSSSSTSALPQELYMRELSNRAKENKVTFSTGTLTNDALSWWNAYAQPIGIEQANKITWTELKRLLTNKYCPRTEVRKMEDEFYNLIVKGNDFKTYIRRF
ncbi:reverse transcriptase domain-containing protein [Tanacetum coccineum]